MKRHKKKILFAILLVGIVAFCASCFQRPIELDQGWSQPAVVSGSSESLYSWLHLHRFQDTVMCLQPTGKGAARCFFLTNNSWVESSSMDFPQNYYLENLATSRESKMAMLSDGNIANARIELKVLLGTLTRDGFRNKTETKGAADKKALFGDTDSSVQFGGTNRYEKGTLEVGAGIIDGYEIYVPYCAGAVTVTSHIEDGPFNTGVFYSSDSGKTWQIERVSNFEGWDLAICRTKNYYYYFGSGYNLWSNRKPVESSKWESPKAMTRTFSLLNFRGSYRVSADGDTVHACWMDSRHDMWRFGILDIDKSPVENDDIVYRHRKDSDDEWGQDVILSKGLLYSYTPSMSVEGNNVVVVWSGVSSAGRRHSLISPNDIYYITSKDGGKSWTTPLKVTDKAKDEFVSGSPQVMLLNGVIHLFYIQGKLEKPKPLEPPDRSGWPIYYTQRPFPN